MSLVLKNLRMSYNDCGASIEVLQNISCEIENGTFVSIIGPSGCGKSTICNLIAGLEIPQSGEILLDDKSIIGQTGNVGYMPQKDLLLPWRTLLENVILGSDIQRRDKKLAREEARYWLEQFGLLEFASYYPYQLSGGMRQRAALLRTILFNKPTLLLDEPFGALDALTRREMQQWLLSIWKGLKHTVVFVTHDIEEAILLSDKIIVLSQRPARVLEEIVIDFPRPRTQEVLLTKQAIEIKKTLLALLMKRV